MSQVGIEHAMQVVMEVKDSALVPVATDISLP
jgi:3-deoxy-D-manno-octulosonic acid (KDO) 8-phosphate synthase